MKNVWYIFAILFLISIICVFVDWRVDGFNFFKFQEQHFYFQSWISLAGILFGVIMAITTFIIYKKTQLKSLKYIPLSFLLTALAYLIAGYHASYCRFCSDLELCAASHNYSSYLIIIMLVIFIFTAIIFRSSFDMIKKVHLIQKIVYGLITATSLLLITLWFSLKYLEIPDSIAYVESINNLQAFIFLLPVIMLVWAFVYFRNIYKVSKIYLLMFLLGSLSFLPQIFHIFVCNDCHTMECSEFYVFSGLLMLIVTGIFIYSVSIQLQENSEQV